jgi:hypothetical protein
MSGKHGRQSSVKSKPNANRCEIREQPNPRWRMHPEQRTCKEPNWRGSVGAHTVMMWLSIFVMDKRVDKVSIACHEENPT